MNQKRVNGQYFTTSNPFTTKPFLQWAKGVGLPQTTVLEPFAGSNNLIHRLQALNLCNAFQAYDLHPQHAAVEQRDTIAHFPSGYDACVTNPPWLARNSASRRKLPFPSTIGYDNFYKHCLSLCLQHCKAVAALIPASFLRSRLFQKRLQVYILLHHHQVFNDTKHPVCLALFAEGTNDVQIYHDDRAIGTLSRLKRHLPQVSKTARKRKLTFNDPQGPLGFVSFDSVQGPSIRFCHAEEIADYPIKVSSRFFTRIGGEIENVSCLVKYLNKELKTFRVETSDVFLTPFKGLRKDGFYRRRMDFALARQFICMCSHSL